MDSLGGERQTAARTRESALHVPTTFTSLLASLSWVEYAYIGGQLAVGTVTLYWNSSSHTRNPSFLLFFFSCRFTLVFGFFKTKLLYVSAPLVIFNCKKRARSNYDFAPILEWNRSFIPIFLDFMCFYDNSNYFR